MDARRAVKSLAANVMDRSGLRTAIAGARRVAAGGRRVVVLGYHRVCRDFDFERQRAIESCLIGQDTFRQHVGFLSEHFELATMSRAVEVLTRRAQATRDLAVITFDDGYQDVLENALPVLQEFRAPATLYVSSGVVAEAGHFPHDRLYSLLVVWDRSDAMQAKTSRFSQRAIADAREHSPGGPRQWIYHLIKTRTPDELEQLCQELALAAEGTALPPKSAGALDWDGVRALAAGGFEIGAHTVSHCVLTHMDEQSVRQELTLSREAIERALGQPVRHFAYCNGYYNRVVIRALEACGYLSAVTTEDRLNRLGDDPYRIARRVLWERSAYGADGRTSESLLACQLDDAWTALGFNASESGERPERVGVAARAPEARRLA